MKVRQLFKNKAIAAVFLAVLAFPILLQADPAVDAAVQDFLYEQLSDQGELRIEVMSSAARFPDCLNPQAFLPNTQRQLAGRISVGVRCAGERPSVRYVPVQVDVLGSYLTAASTIEPGSRITKQMLQVTRGDLGRLPARAIQDAELVVGRVARQRLAPGTVIQEQHLREEHLVQRGQMISLESGGRGFVVSRKVEALESGALGDSIRVRLSRRDSALAVVTGRGKVAPVASH